jgi:hypothetical protein
MRRATEFVSATCAYALLWIATRWPAIRANVLFFDDFAIPLHPADFYIGPYRPTLYLEYLLREAIAPHSLWTVTPKIFGAIYTGIAAAMLIELLRAWEVPRIIARLLPLVVVCHPLLADGALWQTYAGLPIVPALITAGAICCTRGRKLAFSLLTLAGILGYQVYFTLAVVYAIAEPVVRRRFKLRDSALRLGIIAACVLVQLVLTFVIRHTYANPDSRGLVTTFDVRTQIHGVFDLMVNGWMPVIAYYCGAFAAMSMWKFVPLVLGAETAIATRRVADTLFAAAIFVIPAAPNLLLARAPYSWRASTPEAYALALALIPLLLNVRPAIALSLIATITIVMIPVDTYEARCRAESWERDQRLMASVPRDYTIALAPVNPNRVEDVGLIGSHDLTWGYDRRTPRMWSEFNDPWMARRYVQNYARMRFLDCNDPKPSDARCKGAYAACASGCNDSPVEYPRAVRDDVQRLVYVCPDRDRVTRQRCHDPMKQPTK